MIEEEIECDSKFPPRFYVSGWDPFGYRLKDGTALTVFVTSNDPHRLASFQVMSVAEHDAIVAELERKLKVVE